MAQHPDWSYTCSVRSSEKGAKVAQVFPSVRLVYGDLDSVDMIEEEAANADIVYRKILDTSLTHILMLDRFCRL